MLVDVIMPKLGESLTEGTIIQWRKKVGDSIDKDEILLEIGTDKVDSEIPSPAVGVLKEILAQPNDVLPVNEVIAETDDKKSDEALTEEIETASDAKDSKDEVLAEGEVSEEKSVESDSEEVKADEESNDESEKDITKEKLKKENS